MDDQFPGDPPMPPPPPSPDPSQPGYGAGPGMGQGIRQGPLPLHARQVGAPRGSLPGLLVLGGGLAVVIGFFLPWLQASGQGYTVTENGVRIGTWGTLILGGFAVARGASMLRPDVFRMQLGTPLIGGALIGVLVALRWNDLNQAIRDTEAMNPGVAAGIGIGVWLVIAGAAAILLGGIMSARSPGR